MGGIIFIIKRKMPALAALTEETLIEYEQKRASRRILAYFLQKLEKFFQRLKILSLKIYNYSQSWTTFLKEKKNGSNGHNSEQNPNV